MEFLVTIKNRLRWSMQLSFEDKFHPSKPQIVRRLHEVIPDRWKDLRNEMIEAVNAGKFVSAAENGNLMQHGTRGAP